jgi:uncharacterized protein YciI
MYLILLTYVKPLAEVEAVLEAHRAYLRDAPEASDIVLTGRKHSRDGGLVMLRAADRAAVDRFIAADPYALAGVAHFEVLGFDVAQVGPGLESLTS